MAIAFDAASTANTGLLADPSLTWSHTCSGADRVLLVLVTIGGTQTITGITYNGVALTSIGNAASGSARVEAWRLIAPATGANNIVVTFSANATAIGGGVSYTGAHQTTPVGSPATATGSNDTPTVNVSSAADEIVQDVVCGFDALGGPTATVGAGQTERWNADAGPSLEARGAGSTETGSGTTTMSWTLGAAATWAILAVAVKPAGAVTPSGAILLLMTQLG